MVTIKNEEFVEAINTAGETSTRIAYKADASPATMDKLLAGETDLLLGSIDRLADYLGFDVEVVLVKRQPSGEQAALQR